MTIKEAINRLMFDWYLTEDRRLVVDADVREKFQEALGMAITALRAQTDFNGTQAETERDVLKEAMNSITHCRECKHRYSKDFEASCPHRVGPCKPSGFCERGEKEDK